MLAMATATAQRSPVSKAQSQGWKNLQFEKFLDFSVFKVFEKFQVLWTAKTEDESAIQKHRKKHSIHILQKTNLRWAKDEEHHVKTENWR